MRNNEATAKALAEAIVGAALNNPVHEKKDIREQSREAAKSLYEAYLGFIDAGFTEKQAFELLLKTL